MKALGLFILACLLFICDNLLDSNDFFVFISLKFKALSEILLVFIKEESKPFSSLEFIFALSAFIKTVP